VERRSPERSAENEAIFRNANDALREKREELTSVADPTPFLCECESSSCRELVFLTLPEYEAIRARPNRFFIIPGHDITHSEIVEENERYAITEKVGEAGERAAELAPKPEAEV